MVVKNNLKQLLKTGGLILVILVYGKKLKSQDLHLTQYLSSNLSLNPAYTGHYDGDFRFTLNHRNQWRQLASPMVTNQLSIEKRIQHYNQEFGIGLLVADDRVKSLSLQQNEILLSGAYMINLGGHLLSAGVQGGVILRQTDFDAQTFPSQWDYSTGVFDDGISTNELLLSPKDSYMDWNVGGAWKKRYNKWILNAGASFFHLTRPKTGLSGVNKERLTIRKSIDLKADYSFTEKLTISPTALYVFTTKTKDALFGLMGMYQVNDDLELGASMSYRGSATNSDALIPTLLMGYKRFKLGFSNDFNVSGLSSGASNKSSYEISLIYTTPSATPSRVSIPCDRI